MAGPEGEAARDEGREVGRIHIIQDLTGHGGGFLRHGSRFQTGFKL